METVWRLIMNIWRGGGCRTSENITISPLPFCGEAVGRSTGVQGSTHRSFPLLLVFLSHLKWFLLFCKYAVSSPSARMQCKPGLRWYGIGKSSNKTYWSFNESLVWRYSTLVYTDSLTLTSFPLQHLVFFSSDLVLSSFSPPLSMEHGRT